MVGEFSWEIAGKWGELCRERTFPSEMKAKAIMTARRANPLE
jgi:hypothetical protein